MINKKKTSVEWLVEEINKQKAWADPSKLDPIIEQAKAMHKEEITDAVNFGDEYGQITTYLTVEKYYNETYGGNNE